MRKLKITLSYDGTNYVGWQTQPNGTSIQQLVQDAFREIAGIHVNVVAAGRTDAGVHAIAQVAHAEYGGDIPADGLRKALNSLLPDDIAVTQIEDAAPSFHAMRDAVGKRYLYRMVLSDGKVPLLRDRAWQMSGDLDIGAMREASRELVGRHDFESFRAAGCSSPDAICDVRSIEMAESQEFNLYLDGKGRAIDIAFEGESFLRHMVRNIVGTLVEVGQGKLTADGVKRILEQKNRQVAGICAPACGLYLVKVFY